MTSHHQTERCTRRREEILEEATKLFAAQGYARAKVDDIALRLGVAKGTIYRYFSTKEELFLAAADKGIKDLLNALSTATEQIGDPFERFTTGVKEYLSFFDANLHLIEIFVHERAEFRDRKKPTSLAYRDRNIRKLEVWLAEMKKKGLVRNVDEVSTAAMLGDLLYGTVYTHFLRGSGKNLKRLAPRIVDVFFNGILTEAGRKTCRALQK